MEKKYRKPSEDFAGIKFGDKWVLLVQDTCDASLNGHRKTEGLGYSSEHVRGVKLHSCLAETTDGSPLGLLGQQYETRAVKKITLTHEEKAGFIIF